jgi:hypothetical protein
VIELCSKRTKSHTSQKVTFLESTLAVEKQNKITVEEMVQFYVGRGLYLQNRTKKHTYYIGQTVLRFIQ